MGGKDVIHMKQQQKSNLEPPEVQKLLKEHADKLFFGDVDPAELSGKPKVIKSHK
jgi:hypothetical protein